MHGPPHCWSLALLPTLAELGWWVHLLTKRAEMRTNPEKRAKDLYDARNYHTMMGARLEMAERP
jgi:hypothetical protein